MNVQVFGNLHSLEGPLFPVIAPWGGCGQKERWKLFPLGKERVLLLKESREPHGSLEDARHPPSTPWPQVLVASFTSTVCTGEAGRYVMLEALGVWPLPLVGLKRQAYFYLSSSCMHIIVTL